MEMGIEIACELVGYYKKYGFRRLTPIERWERGLGEAVPEGKTDVKQLLPVVRTTPRAFNFDLEEEKNGCE